MKSIAVFTPLEACAGVVSDEAFVSGDRDDSKSKITVYYGKPWCLKAY